MISRAKRILLVTLAVVFLCLGSAAGTLLYFYHHPSNVKSLVEGSLSRITASAWTIGDLSFGISPLRVAAARIRMKPLAEGPEFLLDIPSCELTMAMEGSLGRRTLVITRFRVQDPSFVSSQRAGMPSLDSGSGEPSLAARALRWLFALFFFRDIRVEAGNVSNGTFLAYWRDPNIEIRRFNAAADSTRPLEFAFGMEIRFLSAGASLAVPSVQVTADNTFSLSTPALRANLTFRGASFHSPDGDVEEAWGEGKFLLRPAVKQVSFESLGAHLRRVTAGREPLKTPRPLDLEFLAEGTADLQTGNLEVPRFHILIQDVLELDGGMKGSLRPKPRVDFTGLNLALSEFGITAGGRKVEIKDVRILAPKGVMDGERVSLLLPEITLKSSLSKDLQLSLQVDPEGGRMGMRGEKAGLLNSLHEFHLLPGAWRFSGEDSVRVEAAFKTGGEWSLSGTLGLEQLKFQGPDPSWLGEGISLSCEVTGKGNLKDPSLNFTSTVEVDQGEVLFDRFYFDLKKNGLSGSWQGQYDPIRKSLRLSDAQMVLRDVVKLSLQGSLDHERGDPSLSVSVHVPKTPVAPLFQQLLLGPFKNDAPFLQSVGTGGEVSLDLQMDGQGPDWELGGHFTWHKGNLSSGDHFVDLKDVELDLPIWYRKGRGREVETKASAGILDIGSMSIAAFHDQPLKVELRSGPNRLHANGPTFFRVPGGVVEIGPLVWEGMGISSTSLQTSLSLEGLDLQPLFAGLWSKPVEGSLSGRLDPVRLEEGVLTSQGQMRGRVFGGEVVVTSLGASGILTGSPVLKLDAQWEGLSLSDLTGDTSFGKIQGLIRGHIRNLEIAHAQPQRFDLLLETVQKKGVPQTISVTAVDSISKIGSGQSPFMGAAGVFSSLFREFSYEKIGVRASLGNDVFTINGTIKEDGVEYLVKKGGFSGVNVVNQNPDNRISFKDMVKRIQRVGSSESGPVVR